MTDLKPMCPKCHVESEERWMVYSKFYYCVGCKEEVLFKSGNESDENEVYERLKNTILYY